MKIIHLLCRSFLLLSVLVGSGSADAAEITSTRSQFGTCYMYIVDRIERGDEDKFRTEALRRIKDDDCYIIAVSIYSTGGHLPTAIKIGEQIFALGLMTRSPLERTGKNGRRLHLCHFYPNKDEWTYDPISRQGDTRCQCVSACFFIWAAGSQRVGPFVQVHRPYYDPQQYSKLTVEEARREYA